MMQIGGNAFFKCVSGDWFRCIHVLQFWMDFICHSIIHGVNKTQFSDGLEVK